MLKGILRVSNPIVKELSFGELVNGDANGIAVGECDESGGSNESPSSEESTSSEKDEDDAETPPTESMPKLSWPVSKDPEARRARSPAKPTVPNTAARSRSRPKYQPQPPIELPNIAPSSPRPRLRPSKSFSGSPISTVTWA